ncbi:MAG: hypothetical protein KDC75_26925, partial [Phaeodactylibacter sp.]|nr:hypothetical protein [Phaeodactylibacter sp.]
KGAKALLVPAAFIAVPLLLVLHPFLKVSVLVHSFGLTKCINAGLHKCINAYFISTGASEAWAVFFLSLSKLTNAAPGKQKKGGKFPQKNRSHPEF